MKNSLCCYREEAEVRRGDLVFKVILRRNGWISLLTFLFLISALPVYADPSSANYQLGDSYFPAGSGGGSSSSYQVGESTVDYFEKSTASSTNYAVENKVGISGLQKIPVIQSVTPGDYARFYTDENASYAVSATTPDSDSLQYRAKEDAATKVAAQSSSTLAWTLAGGDKGRHTMSMEVIDPDGTVAKQQTAYIFRRPVK